MSRAPAVPPQLTHAPFRGADAVAAGLLTRRQLAADRWRRLFPDVYVWCGVELDHRARAVAASLFLRRRGAVSGRDAAAIWGADVLLRDAPIEVTVSHAARFRAPPGMRVVRSRLPEGDVSHHTGMRVTSPGRTAFDLARRLVLVEAVVAVDAMLHKRLLARDDLALSARRRRSWPGTTQVARVLELCDDRAESPQESRLRLILVTGGLPRPVAQHEVCDGRRFVARLDLAYPQARLGIEYDGALHRSPAAQRNDARRLNDLRACGWTTLRFTAADLARPRHVEAIVTRALIG